MAVGYAVGNNWDVLRDLAQRYAVATLILTVIAVLGIIARFVWDSRRA